MKNEIMKTDVTNFHIRLKYYANKCEYIPVMETPCWKRVQGLGMLFCAFLWVRAMSGVAMVEFRCVAFVIFSLDFWAYMTPTKSIQQQS